MALALKTVTITGSPSQRFLTDIATTRIRPISRPLTNSFVSWLLPVAVGLVSGAIWGRSSKPNEAATDLKSLANEAKIRGDLATAELRTAQAEQVLANIEDPKGISREVQEDVFKRKWALEERKLEDVIGEWEEEATFRRRNRAAQEDLTSERLRQVRAETGIKEAAAEEAFERSLTAGARAQLDQDRLVTLRERDREQLELIRDLRTQIQEAARRLPPTPPVVGLRRVGPGLPGGIELGRLFGS